LEKDNKVRATLLTEIMNEITILKITWDNSFIRIKSISHSEMNRQILLYNIPVIDNNFSCMLRLFLYTYDEYILAQRNNWIPSSSEFRVSW